MNPQTRPNVPKAARQVCMGIAVYKHKPTEIHDMGQKITQVDAFTNIPFGGNPAAICVMDGPADETWMQRVALEMNLSETAYLHPEEDGYRLRWFTPAAEVNLCGHATVAAAHVLWEEGHVPLETTCRFHTRSGLLTARRNGDWIEVEFPLESTEAFTDTEGIADALGVNALHFEKNRLGYIVVEVASEAEVANVQPDFGALKRTPYHGFMVTARGDNADFVSRFFAPALGVDEDPVTGSAHCVLGPYWGKKLGKTVMTAFQASARGGDVRVTVSETTVTLGGQAVTTMRGELV